MEIVIYNTGHACPALDRLRARGAQANPEILARVATILDAVRSGGDEAVIHYTEEFDGIRLDPPRLRLNRDQLLAAASAADPTTVDAFRIAISNIRAFHEREAESGWVIDGDHGVQTGIRVMPIASAGLYVPGGTAAYPSSVIMNTVPAQVAGVGRIAVATPPGAIARAPVVAAVLAEMGIDEVYQVGGAQAIAALAFGTESIPRVDKIVGPGNLYVALAKKLVYGSVGIDSIAGPTEVVVLADESANPRFIAADLLAQAEHDVEASAVCVTTSLALAREINVEVERQVSALARHSIARESIEKYGTILTVESIDVACEVVNDIAPEHLELMTADNEYAFSLVKNAGAVFFGDWSPEPVGDYMAGPNHVLPTMGSSRFSSPLGVWDFVKRQSIIRYSRKAIEGCAGAIALMAESEGLTAHKHSALERTSHK